MGGKNYRSISSLNRCISSPVHITLSEGTLRSFMCRMYASHEFVKKHIALWATRIIAINVATVPKTLKRMMAVVETMRNGGGEWQRRVRDPKLRSQSFSTADVMFVPGAT